jgi:acyl-CoA synthetase (AMP-forming)/AMP-acid ligase II/thioesterase domain-containing protein
MDAVMNSLAPLDHVDAAPSTIAAAIGMRAALHPDRAAIFSAGRPPLSFGCLELAVRKIGGDLRAAGAGPATRIGVMLPHGPDAAVAAIAVAAHAICYPLNPALNQSELEVELRRAGLDMVLVEERAAARFAALASAVTLLHLRAIAGSPYEIQVRAAAGFSATLHSETPTDRSVAVIQTSSGSTGMPKHVLVTHGNLFDVAGKLRDWYGVGENDRSACLLPVSSPLGFKLTLLAPLLLGSAAVITQKQKAEDFIAWAGDHDPTWFFAPPPYLNAMLDRLRTTGARELRHSLRFIVSGGTPVPDRMRSELETILGVPCLEQYGSRESGPITANRAPPGRRKFGTVGPATSDVAIVDEAGVVLPPGQIGAVVVRGKGVSPGYIESLPAGSDTVTGGRPANQWMQTGDVGLVDEDGFLSIVGRAKQIINRGGEKIAPAEVERAILAHPLVREAAVFGVPHPRLGEGVVAAVVVKADAGIAPHDLQEFLFERLAPHKIPQRIELVRELPRSKAGKIELARLQELFRVRDRDVEPARGNLEALIAGVWERLLKRADIDPDDNFFDLGGDSLLATTMLLDVEALTKRPISPAALQANWTVRHIVNVLLRDMPAETDLVVPAKAGAGTPFFFCHGDYRDRGIYAFRLVDMLEHDGPVYLLNHYCDFSRPGDDRLEDMARLYVSKLLAIQPNGNFRIGGYCLGGIVAWEIARQIEEAGRRVEFVVLIDSPSLNGHRGLRAANTILLAASRGVPRRLGRRVERSGMWAIWVTMRSRPFMWSALEKLSRYTSAKWRPADEARTARWDDYRRLSNYIPPPLETALHCLVCAGNAGRLDFRAANWRRLVSSLHVKVIPGDHHSCVTTFGNAVAAELQDILRRA